MHSIRKDVLRGTRAAVALLAAQHATVAQTQTPAPRVTVTFSKDVAPILNKNCMT